MQQPVFVAIDVLDFPELHDESIPFMAFMSNLSRLMNAAGVRDFTMQVCIYPEWHWAVVQVWYMIPLTMTCGKIVWATGQEE